MDRKLPANKIGRSGFSLLEVIIVLAIIGSIMAVALPRLFDKKQDTRKVFREFVIAGKDIRNRAKLANASYRLAFRMEKDNQSWWVEKASKAVLLDQKKLQKAREDAERPTQSEEKSTSEFMPDTTIFKKEQKLPEGFRFVHIESGPQELVMTEGIAYIHFFPQGMIEPSAIQIEDAKKNIWTLVFNPITGQSDIIPEAKTLRDLSR